MTFRFIRLIFPFQVGEREREEEAEEERKESEGRANNNQRVGSE